MLNPKDKKILIITVACISLIILFWTLIYFPANKKLQGLRSELGLIQGEIAEIKARGGKNGQNIAEMVDSLQKDFKTTTQKLPEAEEETLKLISAQANNLGIEIISMAPQPKTPFLDASNNQVFLEGKQCFVMPISIEVRSSYRPLGEYLNFLRDKIPALIKVEQVDIQKDDTIAPRLRVNLTLVLHLLNKP